MKSVTITSTFLALLFGVVSATATPEAVPQPLQFTPRGPPDLMFNKRQSCLPECPDGVSNSSSSSNSFFTSKKKSQE